MGKQNCVPTMKDVAREAGVAIGTVSKVVNNLPVREQYRIRVERAIKKLDYQVNSYAQGMKSAKTYTAALLIPNTKEPYFASLACEINLHCYTENTGCCSAVQSLIFPENRNI